MFRVTAVLERDRLSVITYDTCVAVDFELLPMDKNNKKYAKKKIKSIHSGSSTNLSGGLLQGLCSILDRGKVKNDVASVLLFTDGLANQGKCIISECLVSDGQIKLDTYGRIGISVG